MTAVQKQLNSIYINNTLTSVYASYNLAHHTEMFPIILELDGALPMFDVDKIPDVIELGEEATRVQVPSGACWIAPINFYLPFDRMTPE